ncbi:MAG: hypothetical protein R3E86_19885 [Pseudomonadales bacterium]
MMRRLLIGSLTMVLLQGCVTATVQQVRQANTSMASGDSVVVLGRRSRPSTAETELDFVDCVGRNMRGGKQVRVIEEQDFRDALFPWFEPRTAPVNASDLPELMTLPALAERFESLGLRYLIWIDGSTKRTESGGSLTCSITTAGAGCFGFLSWENDSSYEAQIWDVQTATTAGRVSSDAVGTSYMPAVIVPLPFIAPVKSSACSSMADQLLTFLSGGG